jgi:hypothetical protein
LLRINLTASISSTAVSVFLRLVLTECHHGFVWSFV